MAEWLEDPLLEHKRLQEEILRIKEEECKSRLRNSIVNTDVLSPLEGAVRSGCEALWDGILCWDKTSPDKLVQVTCPSYIAGFNASAKASKYCTPDGTWYIDPKTNSSWTNYTLCGSYGEMEIDHSNNTAVILHRWVPVIKIVSQVGYGVSIFTLAVAFIVLLLSKRLRCPRNILHMHLFVSFLLRAFMALLKDFLFVQGVGLSSDVSISEGQVDFLPDKDNWACKTVTSLWQFCIMVNYSWILMEGLYLHNLIFMALFTDSSAITLYVILGWGLPVLVVVPWVILRAIFDDHLCWTTHQVHALSLIIRVPIIVSVLVNFVLFLNIIRVLMMKFKASLHVVRRKARYGKWARSTLVLMPLFGVHYVLSLGMSFWLDSELEVLWIFFDQLFASFQGFLVSLLYCLLNGEVRAELTRLWRTLRGRATCHAGSEDTGVTSLLMLSRLHLVRSRGTSLPELQQDNGRAVIYNPADHCSTTLRIINPTPLLYADSNEHIID